MRSPSVASFVMLVGLAGLIGCDNAGVELGVPEAETYTVIADVFLDRDGSRNRSALDTSYTGARVALLHKGSGDTLRAVATDNQGLSKFENVPQGEYRVAVAQGGLGDTVEVAEIDTPTLMIRRGDDTTVVVVRLGYPEFTVRQARAAAPGKPVFLRGVILAGVQSFRDTTSHLSDSSGTIRLTEVTLRGGLAGNAPGDSVSVLGVTSSRMGQPTLDRAIVSRFGGRPAPLPAIVSTAIAASADAGKLDAGLVQVISAEIIDTVTVMPDLHVTVDDGTGQLVVVLDANIQFPRNAFIPTRRMTVRGVLVPANGGTWTLKPRDLGDVTLF